MSIDAVCDCINNGKIVMYSKAAVTVSKSRFGRIQTCELFRRRFSKTDQPTRQDDRLSDDRLK